MHKISKFVHFIEGSNTIHHSLNFRKFEIDQEIADYLRFILKNRSFYIDTRRIDERILTKLIQWKFVVDKNEDEELISNIVKSIETPKIKSLFLIITRNCNLRCSYCFYGNSNSMSLSKKISMEKNIATKAIDVFSDLFKGDEATITFYGGEPLLNFPVIKLSIKHAKKLYKEGRLGRQLKFLINTNGTLISEEFIELAIRENMEVQVSVDGFKEVHDSCRMTKKGQGSFNKVIHNIQRMINSGVNVVPMITVTENNMNELPSFIEWLCVHIKIKSYSMNILMTKTGNYKSDYPSRAAKAMWLTNEASSNYGVQDNYLVSQIERFSGPEISGYGCGAAGYKITVFPEGGIHTCQAVESSGIAFIGDLFTVKEGNETMQVWKERSRFKNESCLTCPIVGACDYGCAAASFHAYGNIMSKDLNHCQWIKSLFKIYALKNI